MMDEIVGYIDGIEYKLFTNDLGPAIRVKDVDSGEVVTIVNYPSEEAAEEAYDTATAAAWQCAAAR
jgi:hypothetical protein